MGALPPPLPPGMPAAPPPAAPPGRRPRAPSTGALWAAIAVLAVVCVILFGVLLLGGRGSGTRSAPTTTTTALPPTTTPATTTTRPAPTLPLATAPPTSPPPPTPNELSRTVVEIVTIGPDGEPCVGGSGTIVDGSGLVLTNFHVIEGVVPGEEKNDEDDDEYWCTQTDIRVGLVTDPKLPPVESFLAHAVAWQRDHDLAVIRLDRDIGGNPTAPQLTAATLGDSDRITLGEKLHAFGFPDIGSDWSTGETTITSTEGTVSGFLDGGNWIKVDAELSYGNSGGALFDDRGELVAIPTQGNFDGPGSIAQARPVNLAKPLIDGARNAPPAPTVPPLPAPAETAAAATTTTTTVPFDPSGVRATRIVISPGKDHGAPLPTAVTGDTVPTFTAATTTEVCVFWTGEGMRTGVRHGITWTIDGAAIRTYDGSETWRWGTTERVNWCVPGAGGGPIGPGRHKLSYIVEGRTVFSVSWTIT